MSLHDVLAEDRRLVILRALTQVGGTMNEAVAKTALEHFGHRVGHDIVRADLDFLARHGLVGLEKIPAERGELWLAKLTVAGQDVAEGVATHAGVKRRGAE